MSPTLCCTPLGLAPSFGFGDRIGLATPGHVRAMQQAGGAILPIFPQQSIREMTRTRRTPEEVMTDALRGAHDAGWTGPLGADADHLKTPADVDATAAAGFTFFTIDPSGYVDQHADDYSEPELREKFRDIRASAPWYDDYLGRTIPLSTGTNVVLTEEACQRAAVKYGAAIQQALALARHIAAVHASLGRDYEMKLVSLAPRFVGELEKGVDYKGDLTALERSLADHAALAEMLGPYKLSLHSGSDKLSMYPLLARATGGRFHVKTAGTSYLEALRVVVRHDVALFRRIVRFAREHYDVDRATYHVSATVAAVPPETELSPRPLEEVYLGMWSDVPAGKGFTATGRQILHCTFGSTLTDPELGPAIRGILEAHPDTYAEVLCSHFSRHLEALRAGWSGV
jgi:hypothetical protein